MARSYRPVVRDQEFLLPPNMADWLPEDHLVWFVIEVIDRLDTTVFHASRRRGGRGRQGYDPDMLLTLLLYAYAVGERSSRRIERLCVDHVAFRVACGQDGPDHSTIARFRAEHQDGFAELFAQVLRLCKAAGMVRVGVVAIDGTKIAANAARGANRSPDRVRDEARRIAEDIVADAAATDDAEDAAEQARGGEDDSDLPPGFATRSGRAANIKKALEELDRQDAERVEADTADAADAEEFLAAATGQPTPGPTPAGVDPVGHQQARITRLRRLIGDLDGVGGRAANRRRAHLRQALKQAERALARAEAAAAAGRLDLRGAAARARDRREQRNRARGGTGRTVNVTDPDSRLMTTADGGSIQGYNAQVAVTDDHLILGVHVSQDANDTDCWTPTLAQATAHAEALDTPIGTVLADAGYFTENNLNLDSTDAGPDRLIAPGKNRRVHTDARQRPTHGPPPDDLDPAEAMRHRLRDPVNAELYKRRGATVEPVIAHLKEQIRLRRFARRGLTAVTAELHLAAAVINLRRLHTNTG